MSADLSLRQAILESGRGAHWKEIIDRAEQLDRIATAKEEKDHNDLMRMVDPHGQGN